MPTRLQAAAAAALVLVSAPLSAKQTFASYEGETSVHTGTGGPRITANGIDYWTSGTPPRRYQLLGVFTDARKDRLFDGDVIGSRSVAKLNLAAGGSAVIVSDQSVKDAGLVASYGNGFAAAQAVNRTTTRLLVVRYLP